MKSTQHQQLRAIDTALQELRTAAAHTTRIPASGWIKTIRRNLGMTLLQLSKKLGITKQSLEELERNEAAGRISLASLQRVAEALDAELVYAIVPRKPLQQTLKERAHELARQRIAAVARSMSLEAQTVGKDEQQQQIEDYARELLRRPSELWK